MNFIDLMINGGADACLGNGSQLNARNIFNNPNNTFKAPSGSACISLLQYDERQQHHHRYIKCKIEPEAWCIGSCIQCDRSSNGE